MRSPRRLAAHVGAALCLALAVFLALLANDVRSWEGSLRAGDVAAEAGPPPGWAWRADETLPFGLARRLLAVDDDLAFRRAVALFRRGYTGIPSRDQGIEGTDARGEAESALARVIRSETSTKRASVAANLLGILAFVDAVGSTGDSTPVERATSEFQNAIRLDPGNDEAKANLELVLQIAPGRSSFLGGSGIRSGERRGGASVTSPGHGY